MPDWLTLAIRFAVQDVPKLLKQNLSRTIVTAVIFTIVAQWAIIGPFGSSYLRRIYLASIFNDKRQFQDIGAYEKNDPALLDYWSKEVKDKTYSDDFSQDEATALQLARLSARRAESPFQPLGAKVTISAPDCVYDRPPFGQIFMNLKSDYIRELGWKIGARARISSQNGGDQVIATIAQSRRDMPPDIHFHLNKVQYFMLRQRDPSSIVYISSSKSPVSQVSDDNDPEPDPKKCPKT
jgi:hypothetical protein